ncbi:MAG: hypothetical protein JXA93_21785 [Anaerolineae bacterium]|nr:hypothetical protein [Anaerolineae bacterium]
MTECIAPSAIQDQDLLAYVEGEASDAVAEHVRACAYCARRAAALAELDGWLSATVYRASCPSADDLLRWQMHLLPGDAELVVAAHVRECAQCQRDLEELTAQDKAASALLRKLQSARRWLEALPVLPRPGLALVRGAGAAQRRYQVDDLQVVVGVQSGRTGDRLMGRFYPPAGERDQVAGIEVWLVQDGQLWSSTTDEQGRFSFEQVTEGTGDLGFNWHGEAVLIRDIELP